MELAVSKALPLLWRHVMKLGVGIVQSNQCLRTTTSTGSRRPIHFLRMKVYRACDTSPSINLLDSKLMFSYVSPGCFTKDSVCTSKVQHRSFWVCMSQKKPLSKNLCQINCHSVSHVRKQVSCLAHFMSTPSLSPYNYSNSCQNFQGMRGFTGMSDFAVRQSQLVLVRRKSRKTLDDEDKELEEELADDDYDAPTTFRKVTIHVKSLRADAVVSSALDISRNKIDELFYASRLRLNGKTLLKKSKLLDEGDYVDLIMERTTESEGMIMVKRVKILSVSEEKTSKDKLCVLVKAWKAAFSVKDEDKTQWQ